MGDLKLFRVDNGTAVELQGTTLALTGDLEVIIGSYEDPVRAQPLIQTSYNVS